MLSHEQLLAMIREKVDHPATPRELLQRLKIPRDERATLTRLLKELVADGALIQTRGNRFGLPDRMNLTVGRITTHPRGFGFVVPDRPSDEISGDIYIAGSNLNQAMHGDRVVARIERVTDRGAEGRILRILERGSATIVGRFDSDESGMGFVVPFDRRLIMDVQIPADDQADAKRGDMVTVEITRWPTPARGPMGRIVEILGDIDAPGVDTEIIIRKYGIQDEHSAEAVAEATRLGGTVREEDHARAEPISAAEPRSPSTGSTRVISTTRSRSSGWRTAITGSACTSRMSLITSARARRSTRKATSERRLCISRNAPCTCFPRNWRRGCAA